MKRLLSGVLAGLMMLSLAIPVYAQEDSTQIEPVVEEVVESIAEPEKEEDLVPADDDVTETGNIDEAAGNEEDEQIDSADGDLPENGLASNRVAQLADMPTDSVAEKEDVLDIIEEDILTFMLSDALPPTADELLAGYVNTTGISSASNVSIDSIEMVDAPVSHLKVSASVGQMGMTGSFNLHLPPKEQWEGRFFQLVHPTFVDKNVTDHNIGFSFDSGAYTLQTSPGPIIPVKMGLDIDAAAAHISRTIAKNYYDYDEHIYGYIYGGSGGSMQTIGAIEAGGSLEGIWDGAVPYISASPVSLGNFNIRLFARVVLEDKAPLIAEAIGPGGSGDPYAVLSEMEAEVLREVTKLGLPLAAWENYEYLLLMNNYATLEEAVASAGTTDTNGYNVNFWTQDGFLGTEDSELGELFRGLRDSGIDADSLATVAYHRHIDPGSSYHTWDHLRDASGNPLYAQIGGAHSGTSIATMMSGNAAYDGNIKMKVIMVQNLMDVDSFPSDGNWYRERVKEQGLEDNYRIWLNQYADHQEDNNYHLSTPVPLPYLPARLNNYVGSLEQALRDLAAWVEDGIEPPASTAYSVNEDNQLIVAQDAAARNGIQPVVNLSVNSGERADIMVGSSASFEAAIQAPAGTGAIVSVEWDYYGDGNFVEAAFTETPDGGATAIGSATYSQVGTYYPQVRVVSQRDGDPLTPYARVENLGRVRVEVEPFVVSLHIADLTDDTATAGESYKKELSVTYNGEDTLEYKAEGLPTGVTINRATGVISGVPSAAGSFTVTVIVSEQTGILESTASYRLEVKAAGADTGNEEDNSDKGGAGDGSDNKAEETLKITGLPETTIRVGDTFTLVPNDESQTGSNGWIWDSEYFSATFNSPATFTALKAGTSSISYTAADGRQTNVTVVVKEATDGNPTGNAGGAIATTGDSAQTVIGFVLAGVVALGALCTFIYLKKRRSR